MASLNKCLFIGNLGRDPEVRNLPDGSKVASVNIAVTERFKDKSGQQVERTEWVALEFFRRQAEICEQYLKKGSSIFVEAKMKTDSWEKDGAKQYKTKFIVSQFQMLNNKGQSQQAPNRQEAENTNQMAQDDSFGNVPAYQEDSLPF